MFNSEVNEFVSSKTAPESEQEQRMVPCQTKQRRRVTPIASGNPRLLQPVVDALEFLKFQRTGTFFLAGMNGPNALEHLAHSRVLRGVRKALIHVPPGQRCQTLTQRIEG